MWLPQPTTRQSAGPATTSTEILLGEHSATRTTVPGWPLRPPGKGSGGHLPCKGEGSNLQGSGYSVICSLAHVTARHSHHQPSRHLPMRLPSLLAAAEGHGPSFGRAYSTPGGSSPVRPDLPSFTLNGVQRGSPDKASSRAFELRRSLVRLEGFEPPASSSVVRRSLR